MVIHGPLFEQTIMGWSQCYIPSFKEIASSVTEKKSFEKKIFFFTIYGWRPFWLPIFIMLSFQVHLGCFFIFISFFSEIPFRKQYLPQDDVPRLIWAILFAFGPGLCGLRLSVTNETEIDTDITACLIKTFRYELIGVNNKLYSESILIHFGMIKYSPNWFDW